MKTIESFTNRFNKHSFAANFFTFLYAGIVFTLVIINLF